MFSPYVDTTYNFVFSDKFSKLNGIYTVLRVMTYDEMLVDMVDLIELYKLVGLAEVDLEPRVQEFRQSKIFKLRHIDNNSVIHMPYPLFALEPDPTIKQYHRLLLAMDLGYYNNTEDIDYVKRVINEIAEKGLGLEPNPVDIFSHSTEWMTEKAFDEIQDARKIRKQEIINLFSENNRLRDELDRAKTVIAGYEKTIINLQK